MYSFDPIEPLQREMVNRESLTLVAKELFNIEAHSYSILRFFTRNRKEWL